MRLSAPICRPGSRTVVTALALLACSSASVAEALELHYEAYLAGALAGRAEVQLQLADAAYRVSGSARSEGLLEAFNRWRASFRAQGSFEAGQPVLDEYHYVEQDQRKHREVRVAAGRLQVVKNGRQRPERAALPGFDLLTGLFVYSRCNAALELNTGRKLYQLQRLDPATEAHCRYQVTDEDGDAYVAEVFYGRREDVRVPLRIRFEGMLRGQVLLVEPASQVP